MPRGSTDDSTFENPQFELLGTGTLIGLPVTVFVIAAVVAATLLVTKGTVVGLRIEAVGGNEQASMLAGISPSRTKLSVYSFSSLCAGIAGLIATADIKAADSNNCGLYLELDAILAVVIGGTSLSGGPSARSGPPPAPGDSPRAQSRGGRANLPGSIIGALIMQTLTTTILMRGVGVEYTLLLKAVAVIAVCLLQSQQFGTTLTLPSRRGRG